MAIRITVKATAHETVLKVDGRLKVDDVEELNQVCRSAGGCASLDLSELQSADRDGLAALRILVAGGVPVRAISPYLELLLQTKP